MNDNFSKKFPGSAAARIIRKTMAALAMLVFSGVAYAQERGQDRKEVFNFGSIPSPATSDTIAPPQGTSAFLLGHGVGTQGYVCLPTATGASWTVNSARPEATLFTHVFGEAVQIITHFLSPVVNPNDVGPKPPRFGDVTWQSSFDSSRVWAQKQKFVAAGTEASCPNSGAIDCLLLQVIGSDEGPAGGRLLTKTTFIQRLNTNGGSAPATGCVVSGDVGKQVLVPYSADYYFFRNDQ
jgi:Protein of unknown function (DUF3455)